MRAGKIPTIFVTAAIAGGILQWATIWAGFAFSGDGIGPEHEFHWISHLLGAPAGVVLLLAIYGILIIERPNLGWLGRSAAFVAAIGFLIDAIGGTLVGWAGGVQGITSGGLYNVGHDVQSASFISLPAAIALGFVIAFRGRSLSRFGGLIPLISVPIAIVVGLVIGATGGDGGNAAVLLIGSVGMQYLYWGLAFVRKPTASADSDNAQRDSNRPIR